MQPSLRDASRERIALAWAEELTELAPHESISDALYARASQHFEEAALVDLTLLVVSINAWNRVSIAARSTAGHYKPTRVKALHAEGESDVAARIA